MGMSSVDERAGLERGWVDVAPYSRVGSLTSVITKAHEWLAYAAGGNLRGGREPGSRRGAVESRVVASWLATEWLPNSPGAAAVY